MKPPSNPGRFRSEQIGLAEPLLLDEPEHRLVVRLEKPVAQDVIDRRPRADERTTYQHGAMAIERILLGAHDSDTSRIGSSQQPLVGMVPCVVKLADDYATAAAKAAKRSPGSGTCSRQVMAMGFSPTWRT